MQKSDVPWAPVATEALGAEPASGLRLVPADPVQAEANLANAADLAGAAALVDRGGCSFTDKVDRCAAAGARAVLVANNDATQPDIVFSMGSGSRGYVCDVPVVMVSFRDGARLREAAASGGAVVSFAAAQGNPGEPALPEKVEAE